jgi:hypothetical protein
MPARNSFADTFDTFEVGEFRGSPSERFVGLALHWGLPICGSRSPSRNLHMDELMGLKTNTGQFKESIINLAGHMDQN